MKSPENEEDTKERLSYLTRIDRIDSKHSFISEVGMGSSGQLLGLHYKIIFFSSSKVVGTMLSMVGRSIMTLELTLQSLTGSGNASWIIVMLPTK